VNNKGLTMTAMEFLDRAERYAAARGDLPEFRQRYNHYRYKESVRTSTWMSLDYLYGQDIANQVEQSQIG